MYQSAVGNSNLCPSAFICGQNRPGYNPVGPGAFILSDQCINQPFPASFRGVAAGLNFSLQPSTFIGHYGYLPAIT
jgi:hypothetical protein